MLLLAFQRREPLSLGMALERGRDLVQRRVVTMPNFNDRVKVLRVDPPVSFLRSPILTDDFAPVDGLLRGRN